MNQFSLSANIETGFPEGSQYIVTPNAKKVLAEIVNGYQSGIHSYTIIGTYGTGKSSFLIALQNDLSGRSKKKYIFDNIDVLGCEKVETLNIVGDYASLPLLLSRKLNIEGDTASVLDALRAYCSKLNAKNTFLVIMILPYDKNPCQYSLTTFLVILTIRPLQGKNMPLFSPEENKGMSRFSIRPCLPTSGCRRRSPGGRCRCRFRSATPG